MRQAPRARRSALPDITRLTIRGQSPNSDAQTSVAQQTVGVRHMVQIHRIHRRDTRHDAHLLHADHGKTEEPPIDQLRGDKQRAQLWRAWGDGSCAAKAVPSVR